jgi:multidrug efflux pump subunit AcrA (membrane-fusion protein)
MTPDDLKTFDCTLAREQRDREIADLRALLAQQAARADAAVAQVERYNEMAGRDADELASLRAREARLREALEPFAAMIEQDGSIDTMSMLYRWLVAINHVHVGSEILYASAVYDLSKAAQSALTGGDHEPVG